MAKRLDNADARARARLEAPEGRLIDAAPHPAAMAVLRAVRAAQPAPFAGLSEAEFEALAARYAERFRREHPEAGALIFPENERAA